MTHPTTEAGRAPVNEMAEIVISVACQQGSLDLFIRNYDAILDSALLIADRLAWRSLMSSKAMEAGTSR
jgi:hypothetical protein